MADDDSAQADGKSVSWTSKIRRNPVFVALAGTVTILTLVATYIAAADVLWTKIRTWITGDPTTAQLAAINDVARIDEDSSISIDVLQNDLNLPTRSSLTINIDKTRSLGAVRLGDDLSIDYAPPAEFNGTDTFQYSVVARDGTSSSALVEIEVLPVNDTPTLATKFYNVSFPVDIGKFVRIEDIVKDADDEIVRVTALRAANREHQPELASQVPKLFDIIIGELDQSDRAKLDQWIVLPVANWVEERREQGQSGPFREMISLTLTDSDSAAVTETLEIRVDVPRIQFLEFRCDTVEEGGPHRADFELTIDGHTVARDSEKLSQLDDWNLSLVEAGVTADMLSGRIRLPAKWDRAQTSAEFECGIDAFASGIGKFPFGRVGMRFHRTQDSREFIIVNSGMFGMGMENLLSSYGDILGQEYSL